MTPDDVTKAAERTKSHFDRHDAGHRFAFVPSQYYDDLHTLARAYLALAPVLAECRRFAAVWKDEAAGALVRLRLGDAQPPCALTLGDVRRAAGGGA